MDSEQWKQLDKLLHAVLERPPEERDVFLRRACGADEQLEREARSLLALELKAKGFLEKPAIEVAARVGVPEESRAVLEKQRFPSWGCFIPLPHPRQARRRRDGHRP